MCYSYEWQVNRDSIVFYNAFKAAIRFYGKTLRLEI